MYHQLIFRNCEFYILENRIRKLLKSNSILFHSMQEPWIIYWSMMYEEKRNKKRKRTTEDNKIKAALKGVQFILIKLKSINKAMVWRRCRSGGLVLFERGQETTCCCLWWLRVYFYTLFLPRCRFHTVEEFTLKLLRQKLWTAAPPTANQSAPPVSHSDETRLCRPSHSLSPTAMHQHSNKLHIDVKENLTWQNMSMLILSFI